MVSGGDLIINLKHTVETGDFPPETSSADRRGCYIHFQAAALEIRWFRALLVQQAFPAGPRSQVCCR